MKIKAFFENLNVYFEEEEEDAPIRAAAYKNKEGDVVEIRVFNTEYNEMIAVNVDGEIEALSIDDYIEVEK